MFWHCGMPYRKPLNKTIPRMRYLFDKEYNKLKKLLDKYVR